MSGLSGVTPSLNAGELVNDAWLSWKQDASDLAAKSEGFLTDIQDVNVTPIDLSGISLDLSGINLPVNFSVPDAPTAVDLQLNVVDIPEAPEANVIYVDVGEAPEFSVTDPDMDYVSAPAFTSTVPNTDVNLVYPTLPDLPTFIYPETPDSTIPDPPPIAEIDIPTIPLITLPTWDSVAPIADIDIPNIEVDYTDALYDSDVKDELSAKISEMLSGSVGIPQDVWDTIFNKAKDKEVDAGSVLLDQATTEWARRGFSLPSGILDQKLSDIRTQVFLKKTEINREIAIEQAKAEVDNLRFAMTQGVAFEGALISSFDKSRERLIAIQELQIKAAMEVLGAQVTTFNAKVGAYKVDAEVFSEIIRGRVAQLESYKTMLQAEKLKLDRSSVESDIYKARLQALSIGADIYAKEVDTLRTKAQIYSEQVSANKVIIDGEKLKIDNANLKIAAYGKEVDAFKVKADAASITNDTNKIKADVHKNLVDAYAQRVSAYKDTADAKLASAAQTNAINDYAYKTYAANLDAIKTRLQQEQNRISSIVSTFDGQARIYASEGSVLSSFKQADIAAYQAQVSVAAENAKVKGEQARLAVEQVMRIAQIEADNAKTAAAVYGQVGAATLAGVSMSAGINERADWGDQYTEQHIHNYEE